MSFPFVRQYDAMDCGPASLAMVLKWHGKRISLETIRKRSYMTRQGVSFLGLKEAALSFSLKTIAVRLPIQKLRDMAPLPAIVHWKQNHFVVVYRFRKGMVWIGDPAIGIMKISEKEFIEGWTRNSDGNHSGLALLLEPDDDFQNIADDPLPEKTLSFFLSYLKPFKKTVIYLILGLIAGSVIQLVLPFLTQAIIDKGIKLRDINFIYLLLFGQLALTVGRLFIDFFRGWMLLHLGSKINIEVVSDFLEKLMKLPISYFDTKVNGDIMQRIDDNTRIESYLTSSSLAMLFSLFSIVVFSIVLAFYSIPILVCFILGTIASLFYMLLFMPSRARLDNIRFLQMSSISGKMINIVNGMQEMKIAGNEESNRKEWKELQNELFFTRIRGLRLSQFQSAGGTLIFESTNILITIISATSVINDTMTLGMMLAVQFIIGQLNAPVSQLVSFLKSTQDAAISFDRLSEIHRMENEDAEDDSRMHVMPDDVSIEVSGLSFQYEGPESPFVLKDVSFSIPQGKVTAIVGESGSGKTTLLKLLMGFYKPVKGKIMVGDINLDQISVGTLRKETGVVMQDGYLFPETIAGNIAPGTDNPDSDRMQYAVRVSNLEGLINSLPMGLQTKVGPGGHGLSQGQRQRILIARAVYKNPSILLLDEATSSLDATNERMIVDNLNGFFTGRTVIVVAHRLSTVKNADNIVVLSGGMISESGDHHQLVEKRGIYFNLIRNQLELGAS